MDVCASAMVNAAREFAPKAKFVQTVQFVLFDEDARKSFAAALNAAKD